MTPADLYFKSRISPPYQSGPLFSDYSSCEPQSHYSSMPVTEFAGLRLLPGVTLDNIKPLLKKIAAVTESFTGKPGSVQYWQQTEDPGLVYLLGTWDSLGQHLHEFIPSEGNQQLLKEADGKLAVELFAHYDVSLDALPTNAEVISIGRHFVAAEKKKAFADCRERVRPHIDSWATEGTPEGGWRVDVEEGGPEEFVLVCGWKTVEQHFEFGSSENFEKYKELRDFMDRFEVAHAKRVHL
jgi:hypothetical protein